MHKIKRLFFVTVTLFIVQASAISQSASVEKVDPPSWWAGMKMNTVRVLVTGKNLGGAAVSTKEKGLKISNVKVSANGNYLFADLRVRKNKKPGRFALTITTATGNAEAQFEIKKREPLEGRNRGYTTDDVIYFVLPDRFADGDQSNNDPPKSKGLYDRKYGRHYHGGVILGPLSCNPREAAMPPETARSKP